MALRAKGASAAARAAALLCLLFAAIEPQAVIYSRTITIDGDMSDWRAAPDIIQNADQHSTDEEGSNPTNCASATPDLDCTVQASGRDLSDFAYTFDTTNLYLFVGRYASVSNATDWWFYLDTDNDGNLEDDEPVLHVNWQGNNGNTIRTLYRYDAVDNAVGDPLVSPITGFADGYDMPGTLVTKKNQPNSPIQLDPANNPLPGGSTSGPGNGIEMETRIAWNLIRPGPPFTPTSGPFGLGFHISASNGTNIPNQIDDNMDGPGGGASLSFAEISLTKDTVPPGQTQTASGAPLTFLITLLNDGPDPAADVVVTDDCEALVGDRPLVGAEDYQFFSATPSAGSYDSGTGEWSVPTLAAPAAPGDPAVAATLTLVCKVLIDDPITVINTATITDFTSGDLDPSNNAASTPQPIEVLPLPSLTIVKSSPEVLGDPVNTGNFKRIPGACIRYYIQVFNTGRGGAEDIVITDVLPANTTLFTGDIDDPDPACAGTGVGTGAPIRFDAVNNVDGVGDPTLTFNFSGLNLDATDSVDFYDSGGASIIANGGFDPAVARVEIKPAGVMLGQSQDPNGGSYEFRASFLVRID